MLAYVLANTAGWLATVLVVGEAVLPYVLRRPQLIRRAGISSGPGVSYLERMRPHYWLGYVVLALSLGHSSVLMGALGRANRIGVNAAMWAVTLLFVQVGLGYYLSMPESGARKTVRRVHFWLMAGFGVLLIVHVGMNG
jgi:hypothetical protein